MRTQSFPLVRCVALLAALAAASCASGVSKCKRNAGDNWRQVGRNVGSFNLLEALLDVVLMPIQTTAECARDIAASPVLEAASKLEDIQHKIAAERVTADDARVASRPHADASHQQAPLQTVDLPPSGPATSAKPTGTPAATASACEYRTTCAAASTLIVMPSRNAAADAREHPQYEVKNKCGESIDCYICGTKNGTVARDDAGKCDDANHPVLEATETWVADGTNAGVDGMALTCLPHDGTAHPSCRTWPE